MKLTKSLGLFSLVSTTAAVGPVPVRGSGLVGIDNFNPYESFCASGCFRAFSSASLECSTIYSPGGHTASNMAAHSLALCRASYIPFLSTVAWCIHSYCPDDVRASTIEHFWETQITGDTEVLPQWTYGAVLANITKPPTMMLKNKSSILNMTMMTTFENFETNQLTLYYYYRETVLESYYGSVNYGPLDLLVVPQGTHLLRLATVSTY